MMRLIAILFLSLLYFTPTQAQKKAELVSFWISPYDKSHLAFYDDGKIYRCLYYDKKMQWVVNDFSLDKVNNLIKINHVSTGKLIAQIYFRQDGKLVWRYASDGFEIVFRKPGIFKSSVSINAEAYITKDHSVAWISNYADYSKGTFVFYKERKIKHFTIDYKSRKFTPDGAVYELTYSDGTKEKFLKKYDAYKGYKFVSQTTGQEFIFFEEKDTEASKRAALKVQKDREAALKFLGSLFSLFDSSSSNSGSSNTKPYSKYGGSSWLKNEHERQTINRARSY